MICDADVVQVKGLQAVTMGRFENKALKAREERN